jgi:hypothetical protein
MTKLGVFGATALSLSLIVATPVLAQEAHNGRAGMHAGPHMLAVRASAEPVRVYNLTSAAPRPMSADRILPAAAMLAMLKSRKAPTGVANSVATVAEVLVAILPLAQLLRA